MVAGSWAIDYDRAERKNALKEQAMRSTDVDAVAYSQGQVVPQRVLKVSNRPTAVNYFLRFRVKFFPPSQRLPLASYSTRGRPRLTMTRRDSAAEDGHAPRLFAEPLEDDAKRLVAARQLVAVDRAELLLQVGRRRESIWDRVGVGQRVDFDLFDRGDADWANARNITPLASTHVAKLPQTDGLRFLASADSVEKFALEEEHGIGRRGGAPVTNVTKPQAPVLRSNRQWRGAKSAIS